MKAVEFPLTITELGVSSRIHKTTQTKKDRTYTAYVVEYFLLGNRKRDWCADLEKAKAAATDACERIAKGQQLVLELRSEDRLTYLRATEAIKPVNVPLDVACRDYAEAMQILCGKGSLADAARLYIKTHNVQVPQVTVEKAVDEMIAQAVRDNKSAERVHQLETYLHRLKKAFHFNVCELTSNLISNFIIEMKVKERTKKNCRDVLQAFCRWCVGRGYLPKGQGPDGARAGLQQRHGRPNQRWLHGSRGFAR